MLRAQNRRGQQRGINGPGFADGQRADRDAAGHLRDREERIEALQRFRFDGNAQHGQTVFAAVIPGRCAAPPAPAMMTSIPRFSAPEAYSNRDRASGAPRPPAFHVEHPDSSSIFDGMLHGFPIGRRAHDDADQRLARRPGRRAQQLRAFGSGRVFAIFIGSDSLILETSDCTFYGVFQRRRDLRALFPILAKLPHQIQRTGNENRVVGRGFRNNIVERLLGVRE